MNSYNVCIANKRQCSDDSVNQFEEDIMHIEKNHTLEEPNENKRKKGLLGNFLLCDDPCWSLFLLSLAFLLSLFPLYLLLSIECKNCLFLLCIFSFGLLSVASFFSCEMGSIFTKTPLLVLFFLFFLLYLYTPFLFT